MKFILLALVFSALFLATVVFIDRSSTKISGEYQVPNSKTVERVLSFPTPTLEQIFSEDHSWVATLSAQKKVTILATGDIVPARSVNKKVLELQNFTWPYEKITGLLKNADLTYINLETPLVSRCPTKDSGMVFCGDVRNVEGLKFADIDIVNFANNHAANHGTHGVMETINLLENNNMKVSGVGDPVYIEIKGTTLAFLGFNDISVPQAGVNNVSEDLIEEQIREARKLADIVIVQFHWGAEYRDLPDRRQIYLGKFTIDAGADLVIGNHPHWIQPVQYYKDKLITYSHGNFIFDQMWSEKTQDGVVGKYTFFEKKLVDVEYFPVRIAAYGQPFLTEGLKKQFTLDQMKVNSDKLRL